VIPTPSSEAIGCHKSSHKPSKRNLVFMSFSTMRAQLQSLAIIATLMFSSSCLHLAQSMGLVPKKPDISLADFKVKSASFSSVDVEVVLSVLNKDSRELQINDLNFEFFLSESKLGSGATKDTISIKPGVEEKIQIPIKLETKEIMTAAIDLVSGKAKDRARIKGLASIQTWAGSLPVPFDREFGKPKDQN
jgi:LEA14-like dessication related protein